MALISICMQAKLDWWLHTVACNILQVHPILSQSGPQRLPYHDWWLRLDSHVSLHDGQSICEILQAVSCERRNRLAYFGSKRPQSPPRGNAECRGERLMISHRKRVTARTKARNPG